MYNSCLKATIAFATTFSLATAGLAPLNSNIELHNTRGESSADTLKQLHRSLSSAMVHRRETEPRFKDSRSIDTSWDGAVLFFVEGTLPPGSKNATLYGGIEIVCTTCYIKGNVTAQLEVNGNFTQAFNNLTSEITGEIQNFSSEVIDYLKELPLPTKLSDLDDYNFPPIDIKFDIEVPDIPDIELQFQFDKMELYMQVDTVLAAGATYTLNLYTSKSVAGFMVGDELLVGTVITVDLILDVMGEIVISSGFHIQLNDGIEIKIPIFGQNVSEITYNGGNFEFLPVTIQSAGVVLTGILRIGLKAGLVISTPDAIDESLMDLFDAAAGIESGVWLDIAQFKTNITAAPVTDDNECELRVVEAYTMALGANAGARLEIREEAWGPEIETQIPIFYTTLAEACATKKTSTVHPASVTASIKARQDLKTTTTVTKITYTATQCLSTGLINCPASLRTTSRNTVIKTLTATVTSGVEPQFTSENTVVSAIAFSTNVKKIEAISGSPISYVPKATDPSLSSPVIINGKTGGVSNNIIIGVSVGLGVPVLLLVIAGLVLYFRRKRASMKKEAEPIYRDAPALQGSESSDRWADSKKSGTVNVTEHQRRI
ncbi:hypothetical protein DL98DRAFT_573737 [Cadophora sp. DSE1049]|nr:hypothetical protein DL98DRAFT_573737 [Cadophora sp. DSE1049]